MQQKKICIMYICLHIYLCTYSVYIFIYESLC